MHELHLTAADKAARYAQILPQLRAIIEDEPDTVANLANTAAVLKEDFPDTDAAFAGADSHALLQEAARRVRAAGWRIANVDCTVIAQAPRIGPHRPAMTQRIASALGVAPEQVNVKAKTAEKLGPVGRGESMEARAVALLVRP